MNETLALMSRDDADELLVAQLGVFLLAAKHSETKADEYILQAAIDSRDARLWLLEALGFGETEMLIAGALVDYGAPLPLMNNLATLVEVIAFIKRYGPELKKAIEAIVELIQLFKGIAPSVPATPTTGDRPQF